MVSVDDKARADFAVGFVTAVARRDKAALATFLAAEDFCKAMITPSKKAPAASVKACAKELTEQNKAGLDAYTKLIAPTFEAGAGETMAIAPTQGIYMVVVRPKGAGPSGPDADSKGVTVTLLETEGKRFVVFPQKAGERGAKK